MLAKNRPDKPSRVHKNSVRRKPPSVDDELEAIRVAHEGILRAEDVVQYAANPRTLLHNKFEWDDGEAAKLYRLEQARQIIRVSVVLLPGSTEPVRAFVSLKSDREESGGGYRSLPEVINDSGRRNQMLNDARADAEVFRRKYETLKEIAPIITAINNAFG